MPAGRELPVLDLEPGRPAPVRERADAARNRMRVLKAAEQLFATRDARHVTMDEIAKAAGVGRATLYRRYPDTASIATALLDEHERQVQGHILNGPPLGPGASPADRLAAFYVAMIDLLERHLHLVLGAETGSARFGTGAYRFWRTHVRMLLTEAGVPDPRARRTPCWRRSRPRSTSSSGRPSACRRPASPSRWCGTPTGSRAARRRRNPDDSPGRARRGDGGRRRRARTGRAAEDQTRPGPVCSTTSTVTPSYEPGRST